jgi:hypothetical protein
VAHTGLDRAGLPHLKSRPGRAYSVLYFGWACPCVPLCLVSQDWARPRPAQVNHCIQCSDAQFKSYLRMTRKSFYRLLDLLQPYIQKQRTRCREPIPPDCRLAIFLYHIGQVVAYMPISNQFSCGRRSVSNIVGQVAEAIVLHLTCQYIRFSTTEEAMRTMDFWRSC